MSTKMFKTWTTPSYENLKSPPCAFRACLRWFSYRKSCRKPGKLGEQIEFGLWGGLGGHSYCKYNGKTIAQKLRRTFLLHFGLAAFRIHFRKTRKPFMFMFFVPSGRDHDSQNQLDLIYGDTKWLQVIQEQIPNHFRQYYFGEPRYLGTPKNVFV